MKRGKKKMTKLLIKTWSVYENSNNTDYKEIYRELETSKRFSDLDAEAQMFGAVVRVFKGANEIDFENISLADYRKLCSLNALEVRKEIHEIKKDSATVTSCERLTVIILEDK